MEIKYGVYRKEGKEKEGRETEREAKELLIREEQQVFRLKIETLASLIAELRIMASDKRATVKTKRV